RVADDFDRERSAVRERTNFLLQLLIAAREEDCLRVLQLLALLDHLFEDARDVAAANPARIDEDGEAFRIESEIGARGCLLLFAFVLKLGMNRNAADFDLLCRHAVIQKLLPRFLRRHQIKAYIFTRPAAPEAVTRIRHDGDERNVIE